MVSDLRFAVPILLLLASCASTTSRIPREWLAVPEAIAITSVSLDAEGKVSQAVLSPAPGPIRLQDNRIYNGDKALTDAFRAVDSFDFSPSRGEVVFSAKRDGDFDIGLVSSDGSPINWVPNDPADEVGVKWAPRGNKISYTVRAKGGDVVRTVHIPTSFELSNDFPSATIHALAWDPQAERYAVAYSTPDASDRVEVMKYDGKERRIAVEPASRLDVEVEPFVRDAIMLRPRDIRYDEKLPVVVWIDQDFAWSDARAALLKSARLGMVITTRVPDEELWKMVGATPWLDANRSFVVQPSGGLEPAALRAAPASDAVRFIVADERVGDARYRRDRNVVSVAPRVVQSFAAGFIADHLKRTSPPNASSR